MACPGSVRLIKSVPPRPETEYAREGTAVHAILELAQNQNRSALSFLDETVEGVRVTEDMIAGADVFLSYIAELKPRVTKTWVEKKFDLSALGMPPEEPMFGTADWAGYEPGPRVLHVVDYKNGSGVVVDVFENKQLLYYALGAVLDLGSEYPVDEVQITIIQPNATHKDGPVRHYTLSYLDVIGFANELRQRAYATQDPNAPLVAGAHCRFCPAAGVCPAQRDAAQAVAMVEFAEMPLDIPPAPSTLPDEMFYEMLPKLHVLSDWIKAMYANAEARLIRGEPVPGYKLVARRANRSWKDEAALLEWAATQSKILDVGEDLYVKKLKSPAQVEKLVGKKNLDENLTQKVSTGYSMVADTDPRPAADLTPGAEFTLLPAGDGE